MNKSEVLNKDLGKSQNPGNRISCTSETQQETGIYTQNIDTQREIDQTRDDIENVRTLEYTLRAKTFYVGIQAT